MPFYIPAERDALAPFGAEGPSLKTFWGDNIMISLVEMDSGQVVPPHSHPEEQAGYVVEGTLEFTMEGATRQVGPGEIFFIPGGVEHAVTVASPGPAKVVDIFSPVRDDYKY